MSVISPFNGKGPAATSSRRVKLQVPATLSARKTLPLVVPAYRRVAEANTIAKMLPVPAGRVSVVGQLVPKLVEMWMRVAPPKATMSASAGLAEFTGVLTSGAAMIDDD